MTRRMVLLAIEDFLKKQHKSGCFEVFIQPQEVNGRQLSKKRSIIVTDLASSEAENLGVFLSSNGLDLNRTDINFYPSPEIFRQNLIIPPDNFDLENSWRGRVMRFGHEFNFTMSPSDFEKRFLYSYFRLIVKQQEENYFCKHDITPLFFSAPSGTVGLPDFQNGIEMFIKFLGDISPGNVAPQSHVDIDFDYLRVFVAGARDLNNQSQKISFRSAPLWGEEKLPMTDFFSKKNQLGVTSVIDEISAAISRSL